MKQYLCECNNGYEPTAHPIAGVCQALFIPDNVFLHVIDAILADNNSLSVRLMLTMDSLQLFVLVIVAEAFTASTSRIGEVLTKVPCAQCIAHVCAPIEAALKLRITCLRYRNQSKTIRRGHHIAYRHLHRLLHHHHLLILGYCLGKWCHLNHLW